MATLPPDRPSGPPSAWKMAGRLLLALADTYAGLLALYLPLRLVSGMAGLWLWPVALMSQVIHWLLLPASPLFGLMLALRRWGGAALAAVPVIAFVGLFGGLFLPDLRREAGCGGPPEACRELTVMTYNIGGGLADPGPVAAAIRASGADVVGLVEVSAGQAEVLGVALADAYPHRVMAGLGFSGLGLASRYPIVEAGLVYPQREYLPYLLATLDVDGTPLTVIVYHLKPPVLVLRVPGLRYVEWPLDNTLTGTALARAPTIVMGDFNTTDQGDSYRRLARAGLRDAWRMAGWGYGATYPARPEGNRTLPAARLVRIDYVWVTGEFAVRRAWLGPDAGSDHLPVLADVAWQAGR